MQRERLTLVLSIVIASAFILLLLVAAFMLVKIYLQRKFALASELARLNEEFERTSLRLKMEIQEETLDFVARECHDNFGQILSITKIQLMVLADKVPAEEQKRFNEIALYIEEIQKGISAMVKNLKPFFNDRRLFSERVATELTRISNANYTTQLDISGTEVKLNHEPALILFRMIQEVLNNIIKHAFANNINIQMVFTQESLSIEIRDNGKGFNLKETLKSSEGTGLQNLRNRARLLNASIEFETTEQKGTRVKIKLPL